MRSTNPFGLHSKYKSTEIFECHVIVALITVEYATVIRAITDYNKVVCTFRINLCFIRILDVNYFFLKINVRENRRGITNGKFRDTDNIGYTRHKTNKGKQKQTEHNTKN